MVYDAKLFKPLRLLIKLDTVLSIFGAARMKANTNSIYDDFV